MGGLLACDEERKRVGWRAEYFEPVLTAALIGHLHRAIGQAPKSVCVELGEGA